MSGKSQQKREGLQVVKVSEEPGRRYVLDEEALESILLRDDIRNLPIVVVSVAGAFRGGKSFILDFFLRYLKAPTESQLTKEWLGSEDELLEGFDWRGGSESNTKGIHIWPEPIVVSTPQTDEKVVVLLMDTQGTFDMESDMGDNSSIFALSTLLSSVQIYNLRANIGEDDLQHLQLFTEYGKLVCNTEGKAFQTLLFLVRDWFSPYEHPYGYIGGEGLLNKRFQPKLKQKKQVKEVREHIHSCFEKLQCFLMPFPGPMVANAQFKGRLCDIEKEFKESLLELVPSLLDPNKLTRKIINEHEVRAQGLLEFFKSYVDIFNSEDLPQATTIFQATVDACMMSVLREARERYESIMEPNIVENQTISTNIMQELHSSAVAAAVTYFEGKKKLGSEDNVKAHLVDLKKELDARLARYLLQNDAKVRVTMSDAKKAYEDVVSAVCGDQSRLCLHVQDLRSVHLKAIQAALDVFDLTRAKVPKESDIDRKMLIESLEKHYEYLCTVNEQNNRNATLEARELYLTQMKDGVDQQGVSSEALRARHEEALHAATRHFQSLRNHPTQEQTDPDLEQLQKDIESYFASFKKANAHSNLLAMQIAEYAYNNYVSLEWVPHSCCFHPRALQEMHEEAKKCALKQFLADRTESIDDEYKDKLIANLEIRYGALQKNNNYNNKQAVDQAYGEYIREMDNYSRPGVKALFIVTFLVKSFSWSKYHEKAKKKAMNVFNEKRRGATYDDDEHLNELKEKIDEAYGDYKNPLKSLGREIGL
ncbi:unnamed protein product [Arctia plantaginis]|uniref:GB1/RHD3-type G domain-containing protein n=1 Tax=Arctia plantaginis TaxID=874455 RepID=A0A8S1A018_ARCPL|nr:unnamed protein product [Arctia plantaginis]